MTYHSGPFHRCVVHWPLQFRRQWQSEFLALLVCVCDGLVNWFVDQFVHWSAAATTTTGFPTSQGSAIIQRHY